MFHVLGSDLIILTSLLVPLPATNWSPSPLTSAPLTFLHSSHSLSRTSPALVQTRRHRLKRLQERSMWDRTCTSNRTVRTGISWRQQASSEEDHRILSTSRFLPQGNTVPVLTYILNSGEGNTCKWNILIFSLEQITIKKKKNKYWVENKPTLSPPSSFILHVALHAAWCLTHSKWSAVTWVSENGQCGHSKQGITELFAV